MLFLINTVQFPTHSKSEVMWFQNKTNKKLQNHLSRHSQPLLLVQGICYDVIIMRQSLTLLILLMLLTLPLSCMSNWWTPGPPLLFSVKTFWIYILNAIFSRTSSVSSFSVSSCSVSRVRVAFVTGWHQEMKAVDHSPFSNAKM